MSDYETNLSDPLAYFEVIIHSDGKAAQHRDEIARQVMRYRYEAFGHELYSKPGGTDEERAFAVQWDGKMDWEPVASYDGWSVCRPNIGVTFWDVDTMLKDPGVAKLGRERVIQNFDEDGVLVKMLVTGADFQHGVSSDDPRRAALRERLKAPIRAAKAA